MKPSVDVILQSVQRWFEQVVLGLNLCPFAHKPQREGRIKFSVSMADSTSACLQDLSLNLRKLDQQDDIETLVLICGNFLDDFDDYNQFLDLADQLLASEGWEGIYQIASFHPDYCFEGNKPDDRANWTNRSPYPLLHLIREDSISRAVASHPDVDAIPAMNIERLETMSDDEFTTLFPDSQKKPG